MFGQGGQHAKVLHGLIFGNRMIKFKNKVGEIVQSHKVINITELSNWVNTKLIPGSTYCYETIRLWLHHAEFHYVCDFKLS